MTPHFHSYFYNPKEFKTGRKKKTYTQMFTVALFTRAKRWEEPECPSTDGWIDKTWSIHTVRNRE